MVETPRNRSESVCAALWAPPRAFWAWLCPIGGGDSIPKSTIFGRILTSFPGPFSSAEGVGPPNLPHISSGPGHSFETRPDGPGAGAMGCSRALRPPYRSQAPNKSQPPTQGGSPSAGGFGPRLSYLTLLFQFRGAFEGVWTPPNKNKKTIFLLGPKGRLR